MASPGGKDDEAVLDRLYFDEIAGIAELAETVEAKIAALEAPGFEVEIIDRAEKPVLTVGLIALEGIAAGADLDVGMAREEGAVAMSGELDLDELDLEGTGSRSAEDVGEIVPQPPLEHRPMRTKIVQPFSDSAFRIEDSPGEARRTESRPIGQGPVEQGRMLVRV